jgi:hypothetical protein
VIKRENAGHAVGKGNLEVGRSTDPVSKSKPAQNNVTSVLKSNDLVSGKQNKRCE